ncbi:hypothetical protein MWN34_05965 [Ancylobacter sp. 6x-1]|uniref:Uncharacterized protein n=1 Tax=Ancylobacter crimeensis TaxID=2579147 RepID=A0ABT0D932_9HYPH|nr:hypothetical protein [Ancylobacter crimeensis]MCK0196458.1 hypothetical protein [Ancylobacter crimeensis]
MSGHADGRIALNVDDPKQLLDMLDPHPFRERGLDGEVEDYIHDRALDLPAAAPIAITVHLPAERASPTVIASLPAVFTAHFTRRAERVSRDLSRLLATGLRALVIGLVVLGLSLLVGQALVNLFPNSRLANVMMEGLVIFGWVANWHPMEIFLFEWWPLAAERRLCRRLAAASVTVLSGPAVASSAS